LRKPSENQNQSQKERPPRPKGKYRSDSMMIIVFHWEVVGSPLGIVDTLLLYHGPSAFGG
ncbi:MAG TPA: hypothetical protein PKA08_05980, partial [Elusimicrobiota bacterium]|nr:hypothetical protein [Elusimicrobiota bacterium]